MSDCKNCDGPSWGKLYCSPRCEAMDRLPAPRDIMETLTRKDTVMNTSPRYSIQATVAWTDLEGWGHVRQVPTFYVEAVSEANAQDIAHDVIAAWNIPTSGDPALVTLTIGGAQS